MSHLTRIVGIVDEEEADDEGSNLLLDDEADRRGQVRLAF